MPTFAPKQVAGSTAAVRPVPKLNVAAILPKIGGQLFGDTIYRYSTIVAKAAIQDEDRARLEAQQQQSRAQRESRIIALTESVYAEITSGLIDQNLAIAYADERCRRGVESKVFQYWRWRANMSKSRRQERERHRCLFRHQAKDMSLGLSQVAANPATLSETLQRSVTRRGLSDQVDQEDWDMSLQDSVQTVSLTLFIRPMFLCSSTGTPDREEEEYPGRRNFRFGSGQSHLQCSSGIKRSR
jgi:hypothetical protein